MRNKILKSILIVAAAVLFASLVIITGVLHQYFGNIQRTQLKDELRLAANGAELLGEQYLSRLDSDRYRLTWIDSDGTVLYDSHAAPDSMENHGDREEIREAFATGEGSSTRQSSTLTEQTMYEALLLSDGSVLRISVHSASALALVYGMLFPFILIVIITIALSIGLANGMAKQIVEPLNNLNLDQPLKNKAYDELSPLLYRIHDQQLEIRCNLRILKQKKEEFDLITGNMTEALVLIDPSGRILSINPTAKALFHADLACIGNDFFTICRKPELILAMEQVKEAEHHAFQMQLEGRIYQFDLSRINTDKHLPGIVILAYDITEQKNAEKNRREFTANISHELKTPLQSIIGSAELMENGIVKQDDLPRFMGHIRKEAARLVSLIDDIIRLSQLDAQPDMQKEDVSLRTLSEEVFEVLSPAAELKHISLKLLGEDVTIHGVRRLLYEIIYNLCDNAIKYNKPEGRIELSIGRRNDQIYFTVQDTGIGIAAEHHEKIFERFYRVDKSHSKASGGTGLGLSIVKHAVSYHHGTIEIHSEPDKGTAITVWLESF